jgi:hypothetical protein
MPMNHHGDLSDAPTADAVGVSRWHGATYVTPLLVGELHQLIECWVRRWPFGGWALEDARGSICGYHWCHPLDPHWCWPDSALAAFVPNRRQRDDLRLRGFVVRPDPDHGLLMSLLSAIGHPGGSPSH